MTSLPFQFYLNKLKENLEDTWGHLARDQIQIYRFDSYGRNILFSYKCLNQYFKFRAKYCFQKSRINFHDLIIWLGVIFKVLITEKHLSPMMKVIDLFLACYFQAIWKKELIMLEIMVKTLVHFQFKDFITLWRVL